MIKGIDVSTYQGNIDWEKVKGAGYDFAIIRAGFGKNNVDDCAHKNAQGALEAGVKIGGYWFSYAYTAEMAKREAEYLLEWAEKYRVEMPLCFDYEGDSDRWFRHKTGRSAKKSEINMMADAFCSAIENAGYYAMLYSNNDYYRRVWNEDILKKYDIWYARYGTDGRKVIENLHLQQTSSSGTVPGIKGRVDLNKDYYGLAELIRKRGLNNL